MIFSWTSVTIALFLTAIWVVIGYLAGDYMFAHRDAPRLRERSRRDKK